MTDGDDEATDDENGNDASSFSVEDFEQRLDDARESLEAAETEADLDDVEETLDAIASDLDAADLPEPEEEDEEDPAETLESDLDAVRSDLEAARGPYAEDVVAAVENAESTLTDTRWTEQGEQEIVDAVAEFLDAAGDALDDDFATDGEDAEALVAALADVRAAVEDADLDPDDDAETIAILLDATDVLTVGLDDAQGWDDLEVREKLQAEGFFDVLGHVKDYPPEWAAIKEHEQRGNVEMILLAFDLLDSDFLEGHCLDALARMNDDRAFDAMHQQAQRRSKPAIKALGKMAAEDAVETLLDYVDSDSDPALQKTTFRALGEIGDERATQALADKLEMENDDVRPQAARSLGLLGDTRAVEPLVDALESDEEASVRAAAAWALRQIGTEIALEAAAEHVDDRSYLVQYEAEQAREALGAAPEAQ